MKKTSVAIIMVYLMLTQSTNAMEEVKKCADTCNEKARRCALNPVNQWSMAVTAGVACGLAGTTSSGNYNDWGFFSRDIGIGTSMVGCIRAAQGGGYKGIVLPVSFYTAFIATSAYRTLLVSPES